MLEQDLWCYLLMQKTTTHRVLQEIYVLYLAAKSQRISLYMYMIYYPNDSTIRECSFTIHLDYRTHCRLPHLLTQHSGHTSPTGYLGVDTLASLMNYIFKYHCSNIGSLRQGFWGQGTASMCYWPSLVTMRSREHKECVLAPSYSFCLSDQVVIILLCLSLLVSVVLSS